MKQTIKHLYNRVFTGSIASLLILGSIMSTGCQSENSKTSAVSPSISPSITSSIISPSSTKTSPTTSPTQTTALPTASSTTATDFDKDGISDAVEDELIRKFAPVVRLHKDEQYLPANVPWYLERVRLRFDVRLGFDDQLLDKGKVNLTSLISQKDQDQVS